MQLLYLVVVFQADIGLVRRIGHVCRSGYCGRVWCTTLICVFLRFGAYLYIWHGDNTNTANHLAGLLGVAVGILWISKCIPKESQLEVIGIQFEFLSIAA